jgi:hypothetical protein
MVDQTIAKPLSLIKDFKILVHGVLYLVAFTMAWSSVLDFSYSMLLSNPWLRDVEVSHDWGNNNINMQGMGIVITIHVTKKLGAPTKRLEM